MRHVGKLGPAVLFAIVVAPPVARAWDNYGHELSAYIAYQDLKPETKKRVNELLRKHPDYERLFAKGCPSGFDKDLFTFMKAATWPDLMRDKTLDPDLKEHHGPWHYINMPIGPNIAEAPKPGVSEIPGSEPSNIMEAIRKIVGDLGDSQTTNAEKAKRVCWLEHLIGDLHQPLHTVSAFTPQFEHGDEGGNLFVVSEKGKIWKLHAYWDDLLGTADDVHKVAKHGDDLMKSKDLSRAGLGSALGRGTYVEWMQATVPVARIVAYSDGKLEGAKSLDKDHLPAKAPELPSGYRKKAEEVAQKQMALAGYRLADMLNATLGSTHE